jgi:hypothetical protein
MCAVLHTPELCSEKHRKRKENREVYLSFTENNRRQRPERTLPDPPPPAHKHTHAPYAQFVTEEGEKLTEKFARADKHLRPALPACLYPPTLDQYTVRHVL